MDRDGRSTYSQIVTIAGTETPQLSLTRVYPNPAGSIATVEAVSPVGSEAQLLITDMAGRVLQTRSVQLNAGVNQLQLQLGQLTSGQYLLKLICKDGCNSSLRLVKQ